MAIAATVVLPEITVNDEAAARRAAKEVAKTIEFVRDESLRTQRPHLFRLSGETIEALSVNYDPATMPVPTPGAILSNPATRQPYAWNANSGPGAGGLAVVARFATSDGQIRTQIYFDSDGVPKHYDAAGHYLLTGGEVTLSVGRRSYEVVIAPITGRVSVEPN